jgi:hypothetical protein
MGLPLKFFMSLAGALAKWALIAAFWLSSVILVTSSALIMDAISDGMSRVLSIQTPYSRQKVEVAQQRKKLAAQKQAVRKSSFKVKQRLGTMIKRNVADAGTSMVPLIGGVASVGFAVTDVYAGCDMVRLQNDLNKVFDMDEDEGLLEGVCATAFEAVEGTKKKAELELIFLKDKGGSLADSVGEFWGEMVKQAAEYMELSGPYSKGPSGAQSAEIGLPEKNARGWVCEGVDSELSLSQKLPPFVLETDPQTLLNLKTVAGAMGEQLEAMPFLNCTRAPDLGPSGKPTDIHDVHCSTSGENLITGQVGVRSHNTNLSFNTKNGWGRIEHQSFVLWSEYFQCTESS